MRAIRIQSIKFHSFPYFALRNETSQTLKRKIIDAIMTNDNQEFVHGARDHLYEHLPNQQSEKAQTVRGTDSSFEPGLMLLLKTAKSPVPHCYVHCQTRGAAAYLQQQGLEN